VAGEAVPNIGAKLRVLLKSRTRVDCRPSWIAHFRGAPAARKPFASKIVNFARYCTSNVAGFTLLLRRFPVSCFARVRLFFVLQSEALSASFSKRYRGEFIPL
jgi:hypothetical protein